MINFRVLLVLSCLWLQACVTAPELTPSQLDVDAILAYKDGLGEDHPDQLENLFYLPPTFREQMQDRFGHYSRMRAARELAHWLVKKDDGFGLVYDVNANLKPSDLVSQKTGNCLSFTLLLVELGDSLGIPIKANQVDLPDSWGENGDQDLVFYRHVNGIIKAGSTTQILDLAIQDYDFGYPQRTISKAHLAALLFSNIGVDGLRETDFDKAFHYLKLSISHFPRNPDMWINLGAAYKAVGDLERAEASFVHALNLSDRDNLAASNLERLYRTQGKLTKARRFAKKASRARNRNPYYQYHTAQKSLEEQRYSDALVAIRSAIRQHDKDHRFFGLRADIHLQQENFVAAAKDLETAFRLTKEDHHRKAYQNRINQLISQLETLAKGTTTADKTVLQESSIK